MRVLLEIRPAAPTIVTMDVAGAETPVLDSPIDLQMLIAAGLDLDEAYPPVAVPPSVTDAPLAERVTFAAEPEFSLEPPRASALIRGSVPDDDVEAAVASLNDRPEVVRVFSDPTIEPMPVCPGDPAVGTGDEVAGRLSARLLHDKQMAGDGVMVAVVDTGINAAHLNQHGHGNSVDPGNSFTPSGIGTKPGEHPVAHGSMCAYDVGLVAPGATLLDHAVLLSQTKGGTVMEGLLSDAVLSFAQLRALLEQSTQAQRRLVVSNSWGVFDPKWDFPPGNPGNYTDNPSHPFNLMVGTLAASGADILFAAGNCGRDCPDGRCGFDSLPIAGANSHPDVLSVAGIDLHDQRVGYSSQGPGRLAREKPDLAAYTHFAGSGVEPVDSGTSASCPVLAGVLAAIRTRYPVSKLSPQQLRALLARSAHDLSQVGYDYDYGWGAVDVQSLLGSLPPG